MSPWRNSYQVTGLPHASSTEQILEIKSEEYRPTEQILEKESEEYRPKEQVLENPRESPKKKSPFLGLLYTFLTSFFILQTSVMVKKLTYLHPGQLSMVRNIGVCVGCLPIAVCCSKEVLGPRRHWPMLFLRSLCGATALYLNLLAYRYLPLAEASIIMSTTPSVVTIAARIYLKEPCGVVQVLAILLTASGMAVSVRLPDLLSGQGDSRLDDGGLYVTGLCCALGCVLLLSVNMVSLRKMLDVHYSVILLYFGVLGALENALLTGTLAQQGFQWAMCGWDTAQVALIGIFGFVGHCFFTMAVQVEAAGIVSTLKSSIDIVLSIILQVLFFHQTPDAYNVVGAALVLVSVSIIGLRKWLQTLPEGAVHRQRLRILLL